MIVDEAQDVNVAELRLLAALGGGRTNRLFFAGDLGQRIFRSRSRGRISASTFGAVRRANIHGDPVPLRAFFAAKGWKLFERSWLISGLEALATESYENSVASIVAKLLLREVASPRVATGSQVVADEDDEVLVARISGYSTQPGFTNANGQSVVRPTGLPGSDYGQSVYVLRCGHCSEEYGANGSDIWSRKCPKCQGGRPGLALGTSCA